MANSRANIYPVQLQGAELNLNKYDAEIKQYSGFNKNNAPFVGGCLSNIFTKDETIEGATSRNTYIAPNGDVYRVTNEGLFKNDEKLVDYTGKKFYTVEELEFQYPDNTVYVDSKECYITQEYIPGIPAFENLAIKWTIHIFNVFTEGWEEYTYEEDRNLISLYIRFDIKCCKNDDTMLVFVSRVLSSGSNIFVFKITSEGITFINPNISFTTLNRIDPVIQLEMIDSDNGILSVLANAPTLSSPFYKNYDFTMAGSVTLRGNINRNVSDASATKSIAYFSESKAFVSNDFTRLSANNPMIGIIYDYKIHNGEVVLSNEQVCHFLNSNYSNQADKVYPVCKNKLGFAFAFQRQISTQTDIKEIYGVCDFITPVVSAEDSELTLNTGLVCGNYVLYNNKIVTGICLPGGTVLASEWNTVEEDNIFVQKFKTEYNGVYVPEICDVIYKTKDKWVMLKESTPELKVINKQVITNVNHYWNAYCIDENKRLLFAPAWNSRFPGKYTFRIDISQVTLENHVFVASSINEYNLEDNCSLIINPTQAIIASGVAASGDTETNVVLDTIFVNLYASIYDQSEVIYKKSCMLNDNIDIGYKNLVRGILEGLPFPTNTDGNIQYSPSLFAEQKGQYGNLIFISEGGTAYKLMTYDNKAVMSYFLSTAIEGLQDFFTIQGQLYGIQNNQIYSFAIVNEVANRGDFVVSVEGLQFCGNTPYEALFFSKTNRCLYSFTGANVLNAKQFVDKISEVRNYKYNPATQSIFLITDIGVLVYSLFGVYQIDFAACKDMYLLNNGVILTDNEGTFKYVKYYKEETTDEYSKVNIQLDTCFYGMNNQTVTINDCLYVRLFSEEHEEGEVIISATTLKTEGRTTENTIFRIKSSDWDAETHTYYLRYQPQEQRGVGISFKITSPFKIAALAVGSVPDAVLLDKASKYAINSPDVRSNNVEW